MGNRFDPNNPSTRFYSRDPFLDPTATESPESAMIEIPGIQTEREDFDTLTVIERDITDRYILDGEIVDDISAFNIAAKEIESGCNACFIFAGEPTWIYWKWIGGTTSSLNAGSWSTYQGEIRSKARQILEAGV